MAAEIEFLPSLDEHVSSKPKENFMLMKLRQILGSKKGQSLVEYGILVGGVALVCLAGTAILGHKANDLISSVAASLPGAHADDQGPIVSGKLVNTTASASGALIIDAQNPGSIESNLGIANIGDLIVEGADAATAP